MSKTRPRRDLNPKFWARPRQDRNSQCLFLRNRDENQFFMKKIWIILLQIHIPIYENETGPSEIETKMRQDQDKIVSNFVLHDKAIIFNFIHDRDETKSLGTLSK